MIDTINPETNRSTIQGETLEQVKERYPSAERISIDDFCKAKAAKQDSPITWHETTEEVYDHMLNVLPPIGYANGFFLVGEPFDHHSITGEPRFDAFGMVGEVFVSSSRPLRVSEFKREIAEQKPRDYQKK